MNKIYQKLFSDVKNVIWHIFGVIKDKFSVPAAKAIATVAAKVVPEGCSRKSPLCKTARQLRLRNPAVRQTFVGDGRHMKRVCMAGFTLIELLVVVLIIGILSAVALPQYQRAVAKSRLAEIILITKSIETAERLYFLDNNTYTTDLSVLSVQLPAGGDETVSGRVTYDDGRQYSVAGPLGGWRIAGGQPGIGVVYQRLLQVPYDQCVAINKQGEALCSGLGGVNFGETESGLKIYRISK